jgi:hypothetical protein
MPIAAPKTGPDIAPFDPYHCEHCGAPITWSTSDPWGLVGQWRHSYPSYWYGQMICDPQQARAALKGKA